MSKKIIIVGAGLAGLSTGIHLQEKGYDTEIFELAPWAGGQCTAWVRKGYRFDGCIHWMVGTRTGDGIHKLYREVEALAKDTVIFNSPTVDFERGGVMYQIPLEADKFRAYLHGFAPEDAQTIDSFCDDVEKMKNTEMVMGAPDSFAGMLRFFKRSRGLMKIGIKYSGKTVADVIAPFKSEKIKELLTMLMPANFIAMALFMMLGTRMGGNAGYPMGGASAVIERMVNKYRGLGGKINFNAKVDEIVIENGKASGIRVRNAFYAADGVVAACDAYDTLYNMLGGKVRHPQLESMLKDSKLFNTLMLVSFGLDKKLGIPFSVSYECPEGIEVAPGVLTHGYHLRAFDFDPSAAPVDASSVMVMLEAPLDFWANLRKDDFAGYNKKKERVALAVREALNKKIPGFADAVKVTDVATPATYVRLTNVYKGSYEGFLPTPSAARKPIKKTFHDVKNLFLCGQWTVAGAGICTAVGDGITACKLVSKAVKQ